MVLVAMRATACVPDRTSRSAGRARGPGSTLSGLHRTGGASPCDERPSATEFARRPRPPCHSDQAAQRGGLMLELLLPRTDDGVAIQIAITFLLLPAVIYLLIRSGRRDGAWVAAGVGVMWIAFTALRTLH